MLTERPGVRGASLNETRFTRCPRHLHGPWAVPSSSTQLARNMLLRIALCGQGIARARSDKKHTEIMRRKHPRAREKPFTDDHPKVIRRTPTDSCSRTVIRLWWVFSNGHYFILLKRPKVIAFCRKTKNLQREKHDMRTYVVLNCGEDDSVNILVRYWACHHFSIPRANVCVVCVGIGTQEWRLRLLVLLYPVAAKSTGHVKYKPFPAVPPRKKKKKG